VFLIDKFDWLKLPKREQAYFRPAVVNQSINYGLLQDSIYLFYPYGAQEIDDEVHLKNELEFYYTSYLLPSKQELLSRARVNSKKWWRLSEHRAWQIKHEAKIVSTYFGDKGSFGWDETGEFAVVQGFAWIPKKRFSKFSPLPSKLGHAYLAILNSNLFSELLSATSNHVGGGQWNLSSKFVSEIAIPNLFDEQINPNIVTDLAQIGEKIHAGLQVDEDYHNHLVELVYGINGQK
jgi:hypothetical protein